MHMCMSMLIVQPQHSSVSSVGSFAHPAWPHLTGALEMRGFAFSNLLCCIGVALAFPKVRTGHGVSDVVERQASSAVCLQVSAREMRKSSSAPREVSIRLVDAAGGPSNAGLLQVQTGGGSFGTVCGMSLAAVDVVCRQLGSPYTPTASNKHWDLSVGLWQATTMARSHPLRARAMVAAALVGPRGALCRCSSWCAQAASSALVSAAGPPLIRRALSTGWMPSCSGETLATPLLLRERCDCCGTTALPAFLALGCWRYMLAAFGHPSVASLQVLLLWPAS